MACLHGHLEVVQSLCLAKANLNKELQPSRKSPVFIATSKGHTEIVKALCVAGADFCQQAANQVTPLHVAVMKGYVELVAPRHEPLLAIFVAFRGFFHAFFMGLHRFGWFFQRFSGRFAWI